MTANRALSPEVFESRPEVAMERPSHFVGVRVQRNYLLTAIVGRLAALFCVTFLALPGFAAKVPVRDGQAVNLKLRNVLTTDNVQKGDVIEFEVASDILVNGHVVIAKGATARGKIVDVKGAYKPRAKDAEVIFQFVTVEAVDQQALALRLQPEKPRKGKVDVEVHERSPIPGQISRVVGADKGKAYTAYVDGSFTVSTSEAIAMAPPAAPATPAPAQPGAPVAAPTAPAAPTSPLAATDVGVAPSSVQFGSTPDGADIVIDGVTMGNTPSTLRLTPGHHSIEVRMAGYRTWARIMVVDPESHPSVRATLIKQ